MRVVEPYSPPWDPPYTTLEPANRFPEGWFRDTLPNAPIQNLAVLRLDGDMYESTMQGLASLYDRLSVGGFVIVDDYYLEACAKATHDFRSQRGITDPIQDIDGRDVFWRRSGQTAPFSGEAQTGRESSPQEGIPIST